ncbi:uncharacterized protein LOC129572533 [Sitodiplosis mosellana]|uniref:uncharacterized protein LOC129572533 n=1 Tax=Sitodiplosis mosellana TaxID=263140 RepID=UPI002443B361|nr:uncharacterized protein LOC129572533 [Sitodiplosis mosellana]
MRVVINLQDNDGEEHNRSKITLNDQATIEALQKELKRIFLIEPEFQQIYFDENPIDTLSGLLAHLGTGNEYKLVLKHSRLNMWDAFKLMINDIEKNKRKEHIVKENVKICIQYLEALVKDKFFHAYPKFGFTMIEFNNKYAHYVDVDHEYIKMAAKFYFSIRFANRGENPDVEIAFKPKEKSGAQGGLICEVSKSGAQPTIYHIKTHLGISTLTSHHVGVDLRELFVYKLLELIKVGPKVHFLRNIHVSRFGIYIATEDVAGFTRKSEANMVEEQKSQLDLLRHILFLVDLHSANYGIDGERNLCIVDFQIGNHRSSADGRSFLARNKTFAKKYIESWNLQSNLDTADHAIVEQKKLLEAKHIDRKSSKHYKEYFDIIKKIVDNAAQ